ncbi:hypothetical protein BJ875DRAFT_442843 [Amylocarpus encephaloides]|uniref:CCHC-type domain-containing protein n=1 Tax=Amylocarpus encephaloides TaxID=45428 RepID=A0A9P7YFL5_9HELO|nr:hypothetical protein BJ875DRAFT_442843 [Amylocarpus encephaloides]
MINRILQALPSTSHWQAQGQFCYRENLDLAQTINSLQSIEAPLALPTASASYSRHKGHYKVFDKDKDKGKNEDYTQGRKCFFCNKTGHVQKNCRKYKRAQRRAQSSESEEGISSEERPKKKKRETAASAYTESAKQMKSTRLRPVDKWVSGEGLLNFQKGET